jgi:hypothetical protein
MSKSKDFRKVKVVRAYYTYHPDFVETDGVGYKVLPTGNWVAEWTIKEEHNPVLEHYSVKCTSEEQAKSLIEKIQGCHEEDSPWCLARQKDEIFNGTKTNLWTSLFSII